MEHAELFKKLLATNVNDMTEKKNDLTYLSWSYAWAEFKKVCPEATYEIKHFNGLPYVYDTNTGYMVFTTVTVDGLTHEMWLPVMDNNNSAMLDHPYEIQTKYKTIQVKQATMFDINKTIMRCLTKNLAMFGLGLYVYAGEDLPFDEKEQANGGEVKATTEQIARMKDLKVNEANVCKRFGVSALSELTKSQATFVIKSKENSNEN